VRTTIAESLPVHRSLASQLLLLLLGLVGLRAVHSGLGLRWEDVDLEARTLKVRRQLQRSRDGSGLIVVTLKVHRESAPGRGDSLGARLVEGPRARLRHSDRHAA
jgi:integrase